MADHLNLDNLVQAQPSTINSSLLTNMPSSVMTDISNLVPNINNSSSEQLPSKQESDTEVKSEPELLEDDHAVIEEFVRNPWMVSTLEDFLFYCCPECPHKCKSSISFTNHAVKRHPKAKEKFGDIYLPELDISHCNPDDTLEDDSDFTSDNNQNGIKMELDCQLATSEFFDDFQDEQPDANNKEMIVRTKKLKKQKSKKLDPNSDFQCYHCGKIIHTLTNIKQHITQVHKCPPRRYGEPRPYSCVHCGAAFEKEKTLLHHVCTNLVELVTKEGEPLTCGKCEQSFASKRNLATHMLGVHTDEKNFGCPQCEYKAKSQLLITKHVRRLHKKERKHLCTICGKSFFEKWNLTDHIVAVHQKKKPYVCDKCGKSFSQKSGLSSHNTFQHPDPGKVLPIKKKREWKTEPTPCEKCGKILMSKYSLEKHLLHTHENIRPFNCETCGKTFKSNSNLKEHITQVHHNKRPFNCSMCDFGSSHKARLEIHIKTVHEEPQDYPCEHCRHVCHKKKELQSHIKAVHGKIKNHKCEYCDSAFYRRRDKEKHLLKTHNIDVVKQVNSAEELHVELNLHNLQPPGPH